MGIKTFIYSVILLVSLNGVCNSGEAQRKYQLPNCDSTYSMLQDSNVITVFKTHFHDTHTYYDLYLDTPDFLLYKNGYSLRFRKKSLNVNEVSYSFQLKSEMTDFSEIRMEVEEKELDFYKVEFRQKWIKLSALLDTIFEYEKSFQKEQKTNYFNAAILAIQNWIHIKANAPIAPFQKLMFLHPIIFSEATLIKLKPVIIGASRRDRIHVYLDLENKNNSFHNIPKNKMPENETPTFFVQNQKLNWVIEASIDHSEFIPLFTPNSTKVKLCEFEVEGKHNIDTLNVQMLQAFDQEITKIMKLKPVLASKFKQVVMAIEP